MNHTSAEPASTICVGLTNPITCPISRPVIKDPGSSITHFIGFIGALLGTVPLIMKTARLGSVSSVCAMIIFMVSMILLYGASTAYHTFDVSVKVNRILKKIDHMMISVLIAGSYTPVCIILLREKGTIVLITVWTLASAGILIKAFWVFCPKWFSSLLYIGMGWTCLLALPSILNALSASAFGWLLAGGIFYTVGGVIYALKLPIFNSRHPYFGTHEIFHCFVMAGSLCHYIFMYCYIA